MYTEEEINLIMLSLSGGSGRGVSVPDLQKASDNLIKTHRHGVYNKVKRADALEMLREKGIECVTRLSPAYPEALANIDSPPAVLYCKGDTGLLKSDCFSVVGSRRTLPKALAACAKIAGELSKVFTVVSGLADGADTSALEGALGAGGKVISVLASGFDYIYPQCNRQLFESVATHGLAVSEYPPDTPPRPYYFPVRNRIIAGLSKGVLVVSAGEKSGALITADYSAEYGRDVYAFPYSAGIASGKGCNALIKKGAYLTENILDIFEGLRLDFNTPAEKTLNLNENESAVLEIIRSEGESFLPAVAQKLGKPHYEIIPAVTALQIKKLIINLGGNRYSAV